MKKNTLTSDFSIISMIGFLKFFLFKKNLPIHDIDIIKNNSCSRYHLSMTNTTHCLTFQNVMF